MRAFVAAALTLGALVVPRAHAEPEWTITGSRTSYVDVTIDTPMSLAPQPTVTTKGRFAGVYIEQISFRSQGHQAGRQSGWVAVRGLASDPARLDPILLGGMPQFEPGVLRVYLIADGPTSIRLRHTGRPEPLTLRPTRSTHAAARIGPLAERDGVWSGTLPMRLARRNASIAVVQVTGERSALSEVEICLRAPRASCPDEGPLVLGGAAAGDAPVDLLDPERRWVGGTLSDVGNVVAYAEVDPPERLSRAVLAAFTLTLA